MQVTRPSLLCFDSAEGAPVAEGCWKGRRRDLMVNGAEMPHPVGTFEGFDGGYRPEWCCPDATGPLSSVLGLQSAINRNLSSLCYPRAPR